MSKGALHRVAGVFHQELGDQGVVCVNIDPGFIATERMAADMGDFGFDASAVRRPTSSVRWSHGSQATTKERMGGQLVPAQQLCHDRGLLPGWSGPVPNPAG